MNNPSAALAAGWRSFLQVAGRIARRIAYWAAGLTWGRLMLVCLLALAAESIINNFFFHWRAAESPRVVAHHHAHPAKPGGSASKNDDGDDLVRIGPNGITISSHGKHIEVPASADAPAVTVVPGAPGAPLPPAVAAAPGAPGMGPSGPGAPGPAVAAAPPGQPPARAGDRDNEGSENTASDDADDVGNVDEINLLPSSRDVVNSVGDLAKGAVLLFIVYLVGSRLFLRQAAQSDARAAQAEQSAAQSAASAEREALQRQLAQAQLQALQAQIEPHFLFNTLASVDYLIETDPARASAMQKHLIAYLRAALPQMRVDNSDLGREVDLARAYLEILKVRMEDRLHVAVDVPDGLRSAEFPPMMLQSLVENAIKHGVEPKPEGGEVRVMAAVVHGELEVKVADTGAGMQAAPEGAAAATPDDNGGSGLGLANVRERLARLYPGRSGFSLEPQSPSGVVATIRLPYQVARQAPNPPSAA